MGCKACVATLDALQSTVVPATIVGMLLTLSSCSTNGEHAPATEWHRHALTTQYRVSVLISFYETAKSNVDAGLAAKTICTSEHVEFMFEPLMTELQALGREAKPLKNASQLAAKLELVEEELNDLRAMIIEDSSDMMKVGLENLCTETPRVVDHRYDIETAFVDLLLESISNGT